MVGSACHCPLGLEGGVSLSWLTQPSRRTTPVSLVPIHLVAFEPDRSPASEVGRRLCSGWSQSLAPDVLTLIGSKQSMCPATGDGTNGGCMRYCGRRTSRPGWRRATDCFPITWTGGTDPERLSDKASQSRRSIGSDRAVLWSHTCPSRLAK